MSNVMQRQEKRMKFDAEQLAPLDIDKETKKLLTEKGLPKEASPFLEFVSSKGKLTTLCETFELSSRYQHYWFLGTTGAGDPICLHQKNGSVVLLDTSNDDCERFVNTTFPQFLACLDVFEELGEETIQANGESAYLERHIPAEVLQRCKKCMNEIDEACLAPYSFWFKEFSF